MKKISVVFLFQWEKTIFLKHLLTDMPLKKFETALSIGLLKGEKPFDLAD